MSASVYTVWVSRPPQAGHTAASGGVRAPAQWDQFALVTDEAWLRDGAASRHSGNLEGLVGGASERGQEMVEEKVGLPGQQRGGSGPEERREGQRQGTFQ